MPESPEPRDPDERYQVDLCDHCHHPGGQHVWGHGCRLCAGCPGWNEGNRTPGWWSARQTTELLEAMKGSPRMPGAPDVTVTLTLSAGTAELLSALIDPDYGTASLEDVIMLLLDHARQGVQRPGAWERDWLCSVFGHDWVERLERDPKVPHHDRVRKDPQDD